MVGRSSNGNNKRGEISSKRAVSKNGRGSKRRKVGGKDFENDEVEVEELLEHNNNSDLNSDSDYEEEEKEESINNVHVKRKKQSSKRKKSDIVINDDDDEEDEEDSDDSMQVVATNLIKARSAKLKAKSKKLAKKACLDLENCAQAILAKSLNNNSESETKFSELKTLLSTRERLIKELNEQRMGYSNDVARINGQLDSENQILGEMKQKVKTTEERLRELRNLIDQEEAKQGQVKSFVQEHLYSWKRKISPK